MEVFVTKDTGTVLITEIDIKIVEALSNGFTIKEVPGVIKVKRSHRTFEARITLLKLKFNCKTIPHLVATFIRKDLIS